MLIVAFVEGMDMGKIEGETFAITDIRIINKIVKFHIYGVLFFNSWYIQDW